MVSRLQSALLTAAAVLLVLVGAYAAGSRAAKRSAELKQSRERLSAMEKAHEVEQTIDALDNAAVRQRASRWVRGS